MDQDFKDIANYAWKFAVLATLILIIYILFDIGCELHYIRGYISVR